jgi:hypothetical protein
MRKIAFLFFIGLLSANLSAQTVEEPEFVGEAVILNADSTITSLEKSPVQVRTQANAGVYIVGIGKVRTRMTVAGCCSNVKVKGGELKLIVRAVDNITDPLSVVQVVKFDKKKKERSAELSSETTFAGTAKGNMKMLSFTGKKFGESSYLLTIPKVEPGEYCVIVRNPNALNEAITIVSCFAVN